MNKSLLPYLKPLIAHELQRMRPIIQAHKRLLQVSTDANIDIGSYIDVAVRIISDVLGKENVNIPSDVLRAEISQVYNILSIKDVTGLNPFAPPAKQSSLEEMTSVLIEEPSSTSSVSIASNGVNCSTSTVSMLAEASSSKDLSKIPFFMLKPPTATETEAN